MNIRAVKVNINAHVPVFVFDAMFTVYLLLIVAALRKTNMCNVIGIYAGILKINTI